MASKPRSDLIRQVEAFAEQKLAAMVRTGKTGDEPAIYHMRRVASLVEESGGTEEEIAAAWLHDVVEDTPVKIEEIERRFGEGIARLVAGLTDPPHRMPGGMPTLERKRAQALHLRGEPEGVKRVKLCDQLDNVRMVTHRPPPGWTPQKTKDYIEGARLVALECKGIDVGLELQFANAYREAVAAHSYA